MDKSTKFVSPFVLKYNTLLIYSYIFPEMADASLPKSCQSEFAFSLLFGTWEYPLKIRKLDDVFWGCQVDM